MNDEFLSNFQEPPRPEFAEALHQRITHPMKTQSMPLRRLATGFVLVALTLLLALVLSPGLRVYAQETLLRIGRLFISNEPTYAEQFEAKIHNGTPSAIPVASPEPIEWQAPPLLSLSEASEQAGFSVAEIGNPPGALKMVARYVSLPDAVNPFTRVTTTYSSGSANLVFSQTVYKPEAASPTLPVGEAPVAQVSIQGVKGVWIENLRLSTYVDENKRVVPLFANLLIWEKNGCEYWLQSNPGLSQAEMLAIATSIKP
jgi:hypothetical protein